MLWKRIRKNFLFEKARNENDQNEKVADPYDCPPTLVADCAWNRPWMNEEENSSWTHERGFERTWAEGADPQE